MCGALQCRQNRDKNPKNHDFARRDGIIMRGISSAVWNDNENTTDASSGNTRSSQNVPPAGLDLILS
jgi:hypothetical protein